MRLQIGECKYLHKTIVLLLLGGIFFLTACSELYSPQKYDMQPFIVDASAGKQESVLPLQTPDGSAKIEQEPVLRLLTPDGKEKIEIFEGQLADGRKIFQSVSYEWQSDKWNWIHTGQTSYEPSIPVRTMSVKQFGVLEVIDPEIINIEYEAEKDKKLLSITEVNSRRFVAYQTDPKHMDNYQIRGLSKEGEILWQLYSDDYWEESIHKKSSK